MKMHPRGGPTIIRMHSVNSSGSGLKCCCCRCCTCLNLQFFKTEVGVLKLFEIIVGFFCQSMALNFGYQYSSALGPSFQSFLTTASWCLMTTLLLCFCYVFSEKSVGLVRQSLFETAFNTIAAFSYVTSCSYLGYSVYMVLHPMYLVTPYFQVYPAMSAAYLLGTVVGLTYGYDAYKSYKYYRGYR